MHHPLYRIDSESAEVHDGGFVRGDASGDGQVDLTDAVLVLTHLFLGGVVPACDDAADSHYADLKAMADEIAALLKQVVVNLVVNALDAMREEKQAVVSRVDAMLKDLERLSLD